MTKWSSCGQDAGKSEIYGLLQAAGHFGEFWIDLFFAARDCDAHAGEAQGRKKVIILARVNRDGDGCNTFEELPVFIGKAFFSYFIELILQCLNRGAGCRSISREGGILQIDIEGAFPQMGEHQLSARGTVEWHV